MKTMLSSRVKKIIKFIIDSKKLITIQDISNEIRVSRRTILREMDAVYSWFESQNKELTKVSNKGMMLDVPESERYQLLDELHNELEDYYYTKEERRNFITTELLQNSESAKLFYFADLLNVSEATISHDLDRVAEWLSRFNIALERKQGIGVGVKGKERDIRKALINIIYKNLDGEQVRNIVSNYVNVLPGKTRQSVDIKRKLLDLIDYESIRVIENAIDNSEVEMGFKFAEGSYTALAVHLALAINRIKNGDQISIAEDVLEGFKIYEEYHIASNLIHSLEELLEIDIPEDEIGYVTMHLKGAKYKSGFVDSSVLQFNEIIISNYKLTSIINKMIKVAEMETGYKLMKNESLLVGLVDHLRPAINRLQMNLDIRNPLLPVIKDKYPEIYDISVKCAKIVEDSLQVKMPESEIGYIAMHIGSAIELVKNKNANEHITYNIVVTCISGIGTSRMLAERIKTEFKNIKIIDVFSTTVVNDEWMKQNEIDLIVSTVHFSNTTVPVIVVNPLLLNNDIEKINLKLNSITLVRNTEEDAKTESSDIRKTLKTLNIIGATVIEILDNFSYRNDISVNNFKDFVSVISKSIHQDKKDAKTLTKELLKREELGSIVFSNEKVIMLHARSTTTDIVRVGIYRNIKAIIYGTHTVKAAIVLLAPKEVEREKLEVIGMISTKLINDPSFLVKIKNANQKVLEETLETYLKEYFNSKNQGIN